MSDTGYVPLAIPYLPRYLNHPTDRNLNLRRKDISDKAEEKLTPDSQKSLFDKAKEGATDAGNLPFHTSRPDVLLIRSR